MALPKTFTGGERLFADDLNDNFQALDSAASAAASAAENASSLIFGTLPPGRIAEGGVVGVGFVRTTASQTISSTTFTPVSGLTVSYTPKFSTSKLLVVVSLNAQVFFSSSQNDALGASRLLANGSELALTSEHHRSQTSAYNTGHQVISFLHEPATTDVQAYAVQARLAELGGRSLRINRDFGSSSLTVYEIR